MRLILNIIWLIFGGLWLALGYLLAALICFVLIITIPFGFAVAAHRVLRAVAVRPHHRREAGHPARRADRQRHLGGPVRDLAGDRPLVTAVAMAVTIIGIPLALANLKLIPVSLVPLGKEIVPVDSGAQGRPHDRHDRWACRRCSRPVAAGARRTVRCVDTFGRIATDLRVSLTDRCNLRCTYCMPAEGLDWMPGDQLLHIDELTRLLRIAVTRLGITSVRFTGGEPLVAKQLEDVVAAAAALRPRPEIALTTNGIGLDRRAAGLKQAGLDRINVSLDTVDAEHFAHITRRDRLADVLDGPRRSRTAPG